MSTLSLLLIPLLSLWFSFTQGQAQGPWMDCAPVTVPSTLPFVVSQSNWWDEYYLFHATANTTGYFKVYTGLATESHIEFMINANSCPYFCNDIKNFTATNYGFGTANISIPLIDGNSYYIFVHVSGANYSLLGCNGPCAEYCPNDCTNFNGVCNVKTGTCMCRPEWVGNDCSLAASNHTAPPKKKQPFGSYTLFYAVVAGLPAFVLLSIIFLIVAAVTVKKQRAALRHKRGGGLHHHHHNKKENPEEQEALLSPSSILGNSPPIRLETAPPLL